MRLPVWRFGSGRNTIQERYGTVLHRASTCGDNCWIEHGTQVCPALYVQGIFSIACVIQIHFVCILKRETRQNYIGVWKTFLLPKKYQALIAPEQAVVLPHHGPNSGLAKTNKASEREMNCHSSSSPFCLATLRTRIVAPQFQNNQVEMCHETKVSSPSFINSLVAWIDAHCACQWW